MADVFGALRDYVFSLDIIDTHEHLPASEEQRDTTGDVLTEYLFQYFNCDLVSAGLPPQDIEVIRDARLPLEGRWKKVQPFWDAARNTGYGRALDITARDLYGFARIDAKTIGPLNQAFLAARAGKGNFRHVLGERCKIRTSLLDRILPGAGDVDRSLFTPVLRVNDFILVSSLAGVEQLAARCGVGRIHSLGDLEDAFEKLLDDSLAKGCAALKNACAYERTSRYEKVTRAVAEQEFNTLLSEGGFYGPPAGYSGKLGDYMMHHICRLADRRGLAFQIHTGLQEGNGNYVEHSNPSLLSNLFLEYANVRFDCFHIGYPFQQVMAALAKNFRNVFIDFCWAHIISPTAAVNALVEFLDSVPANKISGFGGDYCFVDGVYGHQFLARENIARALAIKVQQGAMDESRAQEIARMLLHDNPVALFNLSGALRRKSEVSHRPGKRVR